MDLAIDFRHQGGHFSDKKYPHELLGELPKVGVVVGWLLKPELCVSPTIVGEIVTGGVDAQAGTVYSGHTSIQMWPSFNQWKVENDTQSLQGQSV